MTGEATIDVVELLDRRKIGWLQIHVLVLCAVAMYVDGFDQLVIGFVAPAASRSLGLGPGAFGTVFAASGLGALLGNLGIAPLSDRIGRKPVILLCLAVFGLCSLATAATSSLAGLVALRGLTGFGLGGLMPTACALTAEYTPRRLRVTFLGLVWVGYALGASTGGAITAMILRAHPWWGAFVFGGAVPLLLVPLLAWALPESLQALVQRGASPARIARLASRLKLTPSPEVGIRFISSDLAEKGMPVALLFREGRATMTLLLWCCFFTCIMTQMFLNNWLPTIVTNAGVSEETAIIVSGLLHSAGFINAFFVLPLAERYNRCFEYLVAAFFVSALATAGIGVAGSDAVDVTIAIIFAGLFVFGVQIMLNAIAATVYPTAMRATGGGWALGVGRTGQIIGPGVGGILLSLHWPGNEILLVAAAPSIIGGVAAIYLLMRKIPQGPPRFIHPN